MRQTGNSSAKSSSAVVQVLKMLARRDRSEFELRSRLQDRFSEDEIEKALERARNEGWLRPPKVLAEQMAEFMHRRNKGHFFIQNVLESKGLPRTPYDEQLEIRKALDILGKIKGLERDEKKQARARRLLLSRGFSPSLVRKVFYEKF